MVLQPVIMNIQIIDNSHYIIFQKTVFNYYRVEKWDFAKTISYEDVLNEVSELEIHLRDDKESDLSQWNGR